MWIEWVEKRDDLTGLTTEDETEHLVLVRIWNQPLPMVNVSKRTALEWRRSVSEAGRSLDVGSQRNLSTLGFDDALGDVHTIATEPAVHVVDPFPFASNLPEFFERLVVVADPR